MVPPEIVRESSLNAFISAVGVALVGRSGDRDAEAALARIFEALRSPRPPSRPEAKGLAVCGHLAEATATARVHSPAIASVADSFLELEPRLRWAPRASGGPLASENWADGHANAMIVGRGGLEERDDAQIGVSLMAPHVRYPDHRHGPEEVYLVLSPGRFKHGDSAWLEPGVGGAFHNEPNIVHAMASDEAPLLAIWCLWSGKRAL